MSYRKSACYIISYVSCVKFLKYQVCIPKLGIRRKECPQSRMDTRIFHYA
nr:MAG TPA: hypothetical protein [Caudoviricetes sp.]